MKMLFKSIMMFCAIGIISLNIKTPTEPNSMILLAIAFYIIIVYNTTFK